jgi:hypothetical protein
MGRVLTAARRLEDSMAGDLLAVVSLFGIGWCLMLGAAMLAGDLP